MPVVTPIAVKLVVAREAGKLVHVFVGNLLQHEPLRFQLGQFGEGIDGPFDG